MAVRLEPRGGGAEPRVPMVVFCSEVLCPWSGRGLLVTVLPAAPFPSQLLSLTLDGLTGVSQDHMRAHYQTGSNHMMLNINLWSTLLLGAGETTAAVLCVWHQGAVCPCFLLGPAATC